MSQSAAAAKAAGHPARLRLLAMLKGGPLCVCQMTAVLGLAASTVSEHLSELRRTGLVAEDKQGKWVEYRLAADGHLAMMLDALLIGLATDASVSADAVMLKRLRRVSRETLCAVGVTVLAPNGPTRVGGRSGQGPRPTGRG